MNRTLLILSGALLVAAGAAYALYSDAYIEEETGGARIGVITAMVDIPFGQPIRPEWMRVTEVPQSYVEQRHLRAGESRALIGVVLSQSVRAGEAILRTDLSSLSDQQRTLSGEIPLGMRALNIHAQPESSFGGLLRPGDRVDVLLKVGEVRVRDSGRVAVVAQNLLVLSVNRSTESTFDDDREQARYSVNAQVSLRVTPEQAGHLVLAEDQGVLRLLLRNPNDPSTVDSPAELREAALMDRAHRSRWLRRFALVEAAQVAVPDEGDPDSSALAQ